MTRMFKSQNPSVFMLLGSNGVPQFCMKESNILMCLPFPKSFFSGVYVKLRGVCRNLLENRGFVQFTLLLTWCTPVSYGHFSMEIDPQAITRWWQLKYGLFSPLFGEMIQFDFFFLNGLVQPPTRFTPRRYPTRNPWVFGMEFCWLNFSTPKI